MIRKILGPPGTGKTTKLLHYVRTLVKFGVPLHRIGYFAFTKKAAGEAEKLVLKYQYIQTVKTARVL
jgi:superfamily I DNA/RNA helicase